MEDQRGSFLGTLMLLIVFFLMMYLVFFIVSEQPTEDIQDLRQRNAERQALANKMHAEFYNKRY